MSNLKQNNFHDYRIIINKDEYWDLFLCKDNLDGCKNLSNTGSLYDKCLISYVDMSDPSCVDGNSWIYGTSGYKWDKAVAVGQTLYNISYLGVDNGLFTFEKDRISNKDFVEIFQSNKYVIGDGDDRLALHAVSGSTKQYDYPLHVEDGSVKLNGGFYQGFFKTECDKYQVLPTTFELGDTYHVEMTLRRCDLEKESDKTLNDKYPDNKGIFFYLGTRAENKWVYLYDKDDIDGLEECSELGVGDFVEGGEIDKKDYIIGNFYDLSIDFDYYDPWELDGEYTTYKYYDESLYAKDECDWDDMSDYLDIEYNYKPKTIDEDEPSISLMYCCEDEPEEEQEEILVPFFNGCACPMGFKKKYKSKGITRKFDYIFGDDGYIGDFDGLDYDTEYLGPELDITDFVYYTDNGFPLAEANWYYFYTDNKFLMFDRTPSGKRVSNWVDGTQFMYYGRHNRFKGNLFILMNRTPTGYTVKNIDEVINADANYYDPYKDLYNNAFALRIRDDGSIGYRMLTVDCDAEGRDKTSIIEGYSDEGIIPDCEWVTVNVRFEFYSNTMRLMFYANGKLVYITKELPKLSLRELDEMQEKQEGVPYSISIGGGTQGLAETILNNYMLNPTRVYPLEKYFGGSFIGYIRSFRLFSCAMESMDIENNWHFDSRF